MTVSSRSTFDGSWLVGAGGFEPPSADSSSLEPGSADVPDSPPSVGGSPSPGESEGGGAGAGVNLDRLADIRIGYTLATGRLFCDMAAFHAFAEKQLSRPIFTHEFGMHDTWDELRESFEHDATAALAAPGGGAHE